MRVLPSLETEPRDLRNVDIKIGLLIQNLIGPNLTHARSLGGPYTVIPSITLGAYIHTWLTQKRDLLGTPNLMHPLLKEDKRHILSGKNKWIDILSALTYRN